MNWPTRIAYEVLLHLPGRSRRLWVAQKLMSAKHWLKYSDPFFFTSVAVEINTKCHRRCWYCPQSRQPAADFHMSWEIFGTLLERLKEIRWTGAVTYCLFGEPLLDDRIVDFVRATRQALPGATILIQTNGDLLTLELVAVLIKAGLDHFCIMEHPPFTQRWKDNMRILAGKFPRQIRCERLDDSRLLNRAGILADRIPADKPNWKCFAVLVNLPVRYNGDIGFCSEDYYRTLKIGNIQRDDLLTIWNRDPWPTLRRALRHGDRSALDLCHECTGIC